MKTKSFDLAASLMACGYELVGVDKTDVKRMEFSFEPKIKTGNLGELGQASMEEVKLQLVNKTLMVNAQDILDAMRRLKSVIHSS